eukprot:6954858-Pyramimonas_sp.AAC.1
MSNFKLCNILELANSHSYFVWCCVLSQLRNAIERILAMDGVNPPQKIRFFRAQMQTIITKATAEFPFKTIASRRYWLEERHDTVYPSHPGYDANAPPLMTYELGFPQVRIPSDSLTPPPFIQI